MEEERKIIHIDMDAYYATVEQRDNPDLQDKPIIVGGGPNGRGVVLTCSYEARKYGIHSAMGSSIAYRLCPIAIFVPPRFKVYVEISKQLRAIFYEYTDKVETISLDEAYLDVTVNKKGIISSEQIAHEILCRITKETGLTASAGVSFNKFLAKVGSDFNKPNGITIITTAQAEEFIDNLPIGKFIGVGKVTEKKMKKVGIKNGADLKKYTYDDLRELFGKSGTYFYNMAHGFDTRQVGHYGRRRSIGKERTLREDTDDIDNITGHLEQIAVKLTERMKKYKIKGRTITLRVKYYDFRRITRSITCKEAIDDPHVIMANIKRLTKKTNLGKKKVRLVGIAISKLMPQAPDECRQTRLSL